MEILLEGVLFFITSRLIFKLCRLRYHRKPYVDIVKRLVQRGTKLSVGKRSKII